MNAAVVILFSRRMNTEMVMAKKNVGMSLKGINTAVRQLGPVSIVLLRNNHL